MMFRFLKSKKKWMFKILKTKKKLKKTLIFQLDDPLPPDRNVGPNRPRLRRPPARVGQDVPVHTLSQIQIHKNKYKYEYCADHLLQLAKMFRYTRSHKHHWHSFFSCWYMHYTLHSVHWIFIVCVWQVHALPENLRRRFRPLCHHLGCHQVGFYCLTQSTNSAVFLRTARLVLWAFLSAWPDCFNQLLTRCGVYPTWILYSTLIDAENFVEMFPAYYIFNGLLGTLQLLHILWTYFLFKAIQKALSKGGVDDKRSDSEPSEEEEDENDNQLKKDI